MGPYPLPHTPSPNPLTLFDRKVGPLAHLSGPFCGLGEGSGGRPVGARHASPLRPWPSSQKEFFMYFAEQKCIIAIFDESINLLIEAAVVSSKGAPVSKALFSVFCLNIIQKMVC